MLFLHCVCVDASVRGFPVLDAVFERGRNGKAAPSSSASMGTCSCPW